MILIFLDGVGLGSSDPDRNPLASHGVMPWLERVMGRRLLRGELPFWCAGGGGAAADAVLGVPGLPQSATGQATLLTGVNAQALLGRHQNGFPGPRLRRLLEERSIFRQLREAGCTGTFANAFTAEYFAAVATGRWRHSATTLSALAGGVRLRFLRELLAGLAVYQDITRETLRERGYDVPLTGPDEAGSCLIRIASAFDFTLFEYFQTDAAGHSRDMDLARARLGQVDRFLAGVMARADPASELIVVASDHGNIEDLGVRTHTANSVPVLAWGCGARGFLEGLVRLDQVAPRIVETLNMTNCT
ncbi:MAG: hypothetical protein ACM3X6_11520 [Patescibacteria group bacterium]